LGGRCPPDSITCCHGRFGTRCLPNQGWRRLRGFGGHNPPVGILLCTQKDHALVEYALAGMDTQLFVSKYQLELPRKEEIQRFLEAQMREVQP
jgi:hypothetical protein